MTIRQARLQITSNVSGDVDKLLGRSMTSDVGLLMDLGFKKKERKKPDDPNEWTSGFLSAVDLGLGWAVRFDVGQFIISGSGPTFALAWAEMSRSARAHLKLVEQDHERLCSLLELVC